MKTLPPRRSPWPIVISGFFILFFSGLVTFIIFASTQHVNLVRADYYEEEIRYQEQLDRLQRTGQVEEPIQISYDSVREGIQLQLPAAHAQGAGSIHLYRPSDARLDQRLPLRLDPQGAQLLDARTLRSGLWKIQVQWSVGGHDYFVDRPIILPPIRRAS